MRQDNSVLMIGVIIIISVFYYIITTHENKVERMETIISDQDETLQLQTNAIELLKKQNQFLLQYYYSTQNNFYNPIVPKQQYD